MLTLVALLLTLSGPVENQPLLQSGFRDDVRLLVFSTERCTYCVQMQPIVERLRLEGYPIEKIDAVQQQRLAAQFRVESVPAFVMVADGQVVQRVDGRTTMATLVSMFHSAGIEPARQQLQVTNVSNNQPSGRGGNFQPSDTSRSDTSRSNTSRSNTSNPANVSPSRSEISPSSLGAPTTGRDFDRSNTDRRQRADSYEDSRAFRSLQATSVNVLDQGDRQPNHRLQAAYERAMQATVRIRIEDANAVGVGSGTLIHQRGDEALVLTCGHLFRDSDERTRIWVEVGFPSETYIVEGRVLSHEIEHHDTALVVIKPEGPIVTAQVALPGYSPLIQDEVFSIGCDHGADPTIQQSRVKALTEYGLDQRVVKYDVFGQPANGRSGGGLFTAGGQLIGICNAATVDVDEGIYAGMQSIHRQFETVGLSEHFSDVSRLAENPTPRLDSIDVGNTPSFQQQPGQRLADNRSRGQLEVQGQSTPSIDSNLAVNSNTSPAFADQRQPQYGSHQSTLDIDESEILVVVRSKTDPSRMETVVVRNPSPEFLRTLHLYQSGQGVNGNASDERVYSSTANGSLDAPPRGTTIQLPNQNWNSSADQQPQRQIRAQSPE